jgi:hypothetical protein
MNLKHKTLAYLCVSPCSSELAWYEELPIQGSFRNMGEKDSTDTPMRSRLLGQDVPPVLSELSKGVCCDTNGFFVVKAVLQV